jgi:hypothetical protein
MRKAFKLSIEQVLKLLPETMIPGHRVTIEGVEVPTDIVNLYVYKEKGVDCKGCQAKGSHFYIEKFGEGSHVFNNWHLNLYAINQYGNEVMITKDHILAKSAGGSDELINLQPMCKTCNQKKGCKPMAVLMNHLELSSKNHMARERKMVEAEQTYGYKEKTLHRLKERYNLELTDEEYKSLSKKVATAGNVLCYLSNNKSIRSFLYNGKQINFIYNSELGMLETAIESDYESVKFKYLPAYMTEEFAVKHYTELETLIEQDFKVFDTDKETALYFNSKPHSRLLFCRWKKPQTLGRAIWIEVTDRFKELHRVKEEITI